MAVHEVFVAESDRFMSVYADGVRVRVFRGGIMRDLADLMEGRAFTLGYRYYEDCREHFPEALHDLLAEPYSTEEE